MSRRAILAALLTSPLVAAEAPRVDALLIGDSLAYQLGPRLGKAMHARGKRLALDGRGGSSARQWLRLGWLRRALREHPARLVIVSLGVNCTTVERPKLRADLAALGSMLTTPALWLVPDDAPSRENPDGYRFGLQYLRDATEELPRVIMRAQLDPSDRIHYTEAGYRKIAAALTDLCWPAG